MKVERTSGKKGFGYTIRKSHNDEIVSKTGIDCFDSVDLREYAIRTELSDLGFAERSFETDHNMY